MNYMEAVKSNVCLGYLKTPDIRVKVNWLSKQSILLLVLMTGVGKLNVRMCGLLCTVTY